MNISQEEFRGRIYEVIKDKVFISNISGQMVDVVEKLPDPSRGVREEKRLVDERRSGSRHDPSHGEIEKS